MYECEWMNVRILSYFDPNTESSFLNIYFLPQIKALKREHVETIIEKEEAVDDPLENGLTQFWSNCFVEFEWPR